MRVAIITGGSRGLGRELTKFLLTEGWSVIIDGRDAEVLQATANELSPLGEVIAIPGDVDDADHRSALTASARALGRLDLLVNNASVLGPSPQPTLATYPLDVLTDVYRVNVVAPVGLIEETIDLLRSSEGTIVNVTSDAAVEGYEGWGGYGSSKAALDQVSNVLAAEESTVRVYAFDPGDMRTQMHQDAFPDEDISDRPEPVTVVPAFARLLADRRPSGRYRASELLAVSS